MPAPTDTGNFPRPQAGPNSHQKTLYVPQTQSKPVIAAFDFDGTITTKDTFLPFLDSAFGRLRLWSALARLAIPGLKVISGQATRDDYKARLIEQLFRGIPVSRLDQAGLRHAEHIQTLCRPIALQRIDWHRQQGHRLIMVSASLDFYLRPLAKKLGFDDLLCTRVVVSDGVCTGAMLGENCRAAAKVRYLEQLLGSLQQFEVYAYGNSDGDFDMLDAADHPVYITAKHIHARQPVKPRQVAQQPGSDRWSIQNWD